MSHIHLPDGVLPVWLWLAGWVVLLIFFSAFSGFFKRESAFKKIPLVAMLSGLMVIAMSLEVVPIAYHINLSIVAGIILAPAMMIVSGFIVNLILAFFGHGGITVVGVNTIIFATEGICGYFLFRLFFKISKRIATSAFFAAFLSLFLATSVAVCIIGLGAKDYKKQFHAEEVSSQILKFGNFEKEDKAVIEADAKIKDIFDLKRFIFIVYAFGFAGWVLESFITAFIVSYIARVKKDILSV